MAETINAGHAKKRALVSFPAQVGTGRSIGRLVCIGGRKRSARTARIRLASGAFINRPVEQCELVPEAPRVLP